MYWPETVVNYLSSSYVMVTNHGFFFGALDSGLASLGKSVMRKIMNTNLTKKTGRNVQPISLLQGFLRNFLLYGTCLVYKI